MIVITGYDSIITGKITIEGHANYAPLGMDNTLKMVYYSTKTATKTNEKVNKKFDM